MVNTSCFDYIHPEDIVDVKISFQEVLRTKSNKPIQFRLIHANGDVIDVDCMASPVISDNGSIESVIVVCRDNTDKVKILKELQLSEERYRRLIELFPQPIVCHRDGIFIYINAAGLRLLAASHSYEIIGKPIADIIDIVDLEKVSLRIGLVMEKYSIGSTEYKIKRLDGEWIDVETSGIFDHKMHSVLTLFNDITQRKKWKKRLKTLSSASVNWWSYHP
jgi:two-component system sensor histidine kinase ComP